MWVTRNDSRGRELLGAKTQRSHSRSRSRDRDDGLQEQEEGNRRKARRRRDAFLSDFEGETDFDDNDDFSRRKKRRAEFFAKYARSNPSSREGGDSAGEQEQESTTSPTEVEVLENSQSESKPKPEAFLSPSGTLLEAMTINGKRPHEESVDGGDSDGDGKNKKQEVAREQEDEEEELEELEAVAVKEDYASRKRSVEVDIFSDSPIESNQKPRPAPPVTSTGVARRKHPSEFDNDQGYYNATVGELIQDKYRVLGEVGRGVFSGVFKCVDISNGGSKSESGEKEEALLGAEEGYVAVKIVRNNEVMNRAADRELSILRALMDADKRNHKFVVRLLGHTQHLGHTALIFEAFSMNLRQALRKFGRHVGISVHAVKMYGRQLLVALRFLRGFGLVHADLKLDNILCSGDLKVVKLCDFGSAFLQLEQEGHEGPQSPYLTSRFYRAPEVILGLTPLDTGIDLWSLAVCLFELYTGSVMFSGKNNNDMLWVMMRCRGGLSNKIIKAHLRAFRSVGMVGECGSSSTNYMGSSNSSGQGLEPHFDEDTLQFRLRDEAGKVVKTIVIPDTPKEHNGIQARLKLHHLCATAGQKAGAEGEGDEEEEKEKALVNKLGDVLEKCLTMNRNKRITADDALAHSFFQE